MSKTPAQIYEQTMKLWGVLSSDAKTIELRLVDDIEKEILYAILQGRSTTRYENEALTYIPLRLKVVKRLTEAGYTVTQHGTQYLTENEVEGFIIISWPAPEPPMQHIELKIKYDKRAMSYD
nr:MAG TPA: hypothetical protein [Caudoviricetes sp.]